MKSSINLTTWLSFLIVICTIQCKAAIINIDSNTTISSTLTPSNLLTNNSNSSNSTTSNVFEVNPDDNLVNARIKVIFLSDNEKDNKKDQQDLKVDATAVNQPVFYTSGIFNGLFDVQRIYTLP